MAETEEERASEDVATKNSKSGGGDQKSRDKKTKKKFATKVIIRRLPPSMTEEMFVQQVEPLAGHDYLYFVPADWSLGQFATSRAYINFTDPDDVFLFKDKFDGYVFVDTKGVEYPAIVEFAPFQSLPKNKSRKTDNKCGTIEEDPQFQSFLAALISEVNDPTKPEMKMEYSYQIKDDKKVTTTPLLEFLAHKKDERREERRKKIENKKKARDDEKGRKKDSASYRDGDDGCKSSRNAHNKKDSFKSNLPSSIREEDDDGIVVRTVKSRIFQEKGDRWKNNNKDDQNDASKNFRDSNNRRKDRKNRRNDKDAKNDPEINTEFKILKADKTEEVLPKNTYQSSTDQPAKFFDKPKEEKVKKFSESRRERRASMRNQAAKESSRVESADGTTQEDKLLLRKEQSQDGRKSARDRKHIHSEQNKEKDERISSLDSNGGGDIRAESTSSRAERDAARIRKKDRPSLQIYQPGRRRNSDNPEKSQSGTSSPIDKALVKPDSEFVRRDSKPDVSNEISNAKSSAASEKRISRYSERRNKNKEQQRKQQQSSGIESVNTLNDGMAKLEIEPDQ